MGCVTSGIFEVGRHRRGRRAERGVFESSFDQSGATHFMRLPAARETYLFKFGGRRR